MQAASETVLSEEKQARAAQRSLLEEGLARKPYVTLFALELFDSESALRRRALDQPRLALECLKTLAREELKLLYLNYSEVMATYEQRTWAAEGVEKELAKILARYQTEGKPAPALAAIPNNEIPEQPSPKFGSETAVIEVFAQEQQAAADNQI